MIKPLNKNKLIIFSISSPLLASIYYIENEPTITTYDYCPTTELENHAYSLRPIRSSLIDNEHDKNTIVHNFFYLSGESFVLTAYFLEYRKKVHNP